MGERGKWSGRAAGHGGSATVSITEGEDRKGGGTGTLGLMGNTAALTCTTGLYHRGSAEPQVPFLCQWSDILE